MVRRKRHQDQEQDKQNVDLLTNVHGDSVREKKTMKMVLSNNSSLVVLLRIESLEIVSEDCDMICECSILGAEENISNDSIENQLVTRSRAQKTSSRLIHSILFHEFSIDSRTCRRKRFTDRNAATVVNGRGQSIEERVAVLCDTLYTYDT
jgi:hypothetical protein